MNTIIAFDDIDTHRGGCTTHFTTNIFYYLLNEGFNPKDIPVLVRLNPDTPWKTRGNASTMLFFDIPENKIDSITRKIEKKLVKYVNSGEWIPSNTQPCILITQIDTDMSQKLLQFYRKTIREIVALNDALDIIKDIKDKRIITLAGQRGLIGCLSAIGAYFSNDLKTYELLRYTKSIYVYNKSDLMENKLLILNILREEERFDTFSHVDYQTDKILITPSGNDPVIYGIRGTNPIELIRLDNKLKRLIKTDSRWLIYRTNQATNAHLTNKLETGCRHDYSQGYVISFNVRSETHLRGGHTYLNLSLNKADSKAVVFHEAGYIRKLLDSNNITILYGNCREGFIKIESILKIGENCKIKYPNPICPKCMVRMEKMGENSGWRCRKCRYRMKLDHTILIHKRRIDQKTLKLLEPTRYQRHLTKPIKLYGRKMRRTYDHIILGLLNR